MIHIPNQVTLQQAQGMRAEAEKGSNPALYIAAASAFRSLKMNTSAQAMEKRARHYQTQARRAIGSTLVPASFLSRRQT